MKEGRKVFVIGLDGATFDLLLPWIEQGHLPFFKNLLKESSWGELESALPPLTAPAWASFMTGKSSGNHGIFDFFSRESRSYEQKLNSILDIKEEIFWHRIGRANKKVGLINVPFTYPPQKVQGFMITGLLTPGGSHNYTYPESLKEELEKELGQYLIHHSEKYNKKNMQKFLEEQYAILENRLNSCRYLMKNKDWDFFLVHFYGPDRMQHEFWHIHDECHIQHNSLERKKHGDVIRDYFVKLDSSLSQLIGELEEDTILIILSDHGFGKVEKFFNVNTWLMKNEFLILKKNIKSRFKHALFKVGFTYSNMAKLIFRLGLVKKAEELGKSRLQKLQEKIFLSLKDVDWSKTRAYSMGNFGQIYINSHGRELEGIVIKGKDYDSVVNSLKEKLLAIEDPESQEKIVEEVKTQDEAFGGKYADSAPDLFFFTKDMRYKAFGLADFSSNRVLEPAYSSSGHHKMNGIVIVRKKGVINEDYRIRSAKIIDLAPTILYMLGIPIPKDWDGSVLQNIFEPSYLEQNQVQYSDTEEKSEREEAESPYSEKEKKEMKQRLKDLGYM
jgi:predicted AlkP superfamily phosphohydrolase/phosphomutase